MYLPVIILSPLINKIASENGTPQKPILEYTSVFGLKELSC